MGRSTALGATAWWLAEQGQRVLVLDMDLESPGLSSALLPPERCPQWGIADWLLEDLVDNGAVVLNDMVGSSTLSRNGDIWVVPAHGHAAGDYVSKLGLLQAPETVQTLLNAQVHELTRTTVWTGFGIAAHLDAYPDHPLALHHEGIRRGVQKASEIRVSEVSEDYKHIKTFMRPLQGLSVPCKFEQITQLWKQSETNPELSLGTDIPPAPRTREWSDLTSSPP